MLFRDATIDDLPMIVDIYNSTIAGRMVTADTVPVSVNDKTSWFQEHSPQSRPLWIAIDEDGNTIGWISFQDFYGRPAYQGTAEISIYIADKYRGKGLGKEMLQYSIRQCPALGIHTLLGFIFEQNANSLRLFYNLGFKEWGHLEDVALLDGKPCSLKILGRKTGK
jgi:phosphinothricin acetyltransferase